MSTRIDATCNPHLPKLAWAAFIEPARGSVRAVHGSGVECTDRWLVEGCWDGSFVDGNFHLTPHFFGSGLRLDGDRVHVVPSAALVDRILMCRKDDTLIVSNSLLVLLAVIGGRLSPEYDYRPVCHASTAGASSYDKIVPIAHDSIAHVEQIYCERALVSTHGVRFAPAAPTPIFTRFEAYEAALTRTLGNLHDNVSSPRRDHPMSAYSTVSTGYDSTAVAALVGDLGVRTCFTTRPHARPSAGRLEDGASVAEALGLEVLHLESRIPDASTERYCLAGTFDGRETVFVNMCDFFQERAGVQVLFSGYHGDKVWDRHSSGEYLGDDLRRGDTSGLNLCEIRLKAGFVNVAVPFLFARGIRSIVAVANSPEMAPWRVGGSYDRPVARRLAEQRGVPRERFGRRKAVVMEYYTYPQNPDLRRAFYDHLDRTQDFGWLGRMAYALCEQADYRYQALTGRWSWLSRLVPASGQLRDRLRPGARNVANALYVWAVNGLVDELGSELGAGHRPALDAGRGHTLRGIP